MLGCYFLPVLEKREIGANNFPENVAVMYFNRTLEPPDCFQIEGVSLSVYSRFFMEVRQFK